MTAGPAPRTLREVLHLVDRQPPADGARLLRQTLDGLPAEAGPELRATLLSRLAELLVSESAADRAARVEEALALLVQARDALAGRPGWLPSAVAAQLAELYLQRVQGDRGDNVDQAIALAGEATRMVSRLAHPEVWAVGRLLMGRAERMRATDAAEPSREAALDRALAALRQASREFTAIPAPEQDAAVQLELSQVYRERTAGGRSENYAQARRCCERALEELASDGQSALWGAVQNELGLVWLGHPLGDRDENLRRARQAFERALSARQPGTEPWATSMTNLGIVLASAKDYGGARRCYDAALRVRTREAFPTQWAETVLNRATAEAMDPDDPIGGLRHAIESWRATLQVYDAVGHPLRRARVLEMIGIALVRLSHAERSTARVLRAEAADALSAAVELLGSGGAPADALRAASRLARLSAEDGAWDSAREAYRLTLAYFELLYRSAVLQQSQEQELATADGLGPDAAYACVRARDLPEAVTILEHFRARRLGDLLMRDRADLTALQRDAPQLHARFVALATRARTAERAELRTLGGTDFALT